jgi:antitoxin VapB
MTTQLNIKSAEARRLAHELSQLTGRSMTEVIVASLRDRLSRVRYARTSEEERAREKESGFYDLIAGSRGLWKDHMLSIDHADLLYDEDGLPR